MKLISRTHVHDLGDGPIPRGKAFECDDKVAREKIAKGTAEAFDKADAENADSGDGDGGGSDSAEDRLDKIVDAVMGLDSAEDAPDLYTSAGSPTTKVLSDAVGFTVTSQERDAAWATFQE